MPRGHDTELNRNILFHPLYFFLFLFLRRLDIIRSTFKITQPNFSIGTSRVTTVEYFSLYLNDMLHHLEGIVVAVNIPEDYSQLML